MQTENHTSSEQKEQPLDIVWIINYLCYRWRVIAISTAVFVAIGMIKYAVTPNVYTAEATLLPTLDNSANSLKGLSGLASMAGVDLSSATGQSTVQIYPELYSSVITSTPALLSLMEVPLPWEKPDTILTLYEHMALVVEKERNPTAWDYVKKYTIKLPKTILEAIVPRKEFVAELPTSGVDESLLEKPIVLDIVRNRSAMWLKENISVVIDESLGLVQIAVNGESPKQSADLAIAVIEQMQRSVTNYKTMDAQKTLNFIQKRYNETMHDYEETRRAFYEYTDSHRDFVEERTDIRKQKLEDAYNMNYSLLQNLQQSLENARIKMMAENPVFSVVEPVVMPEKQTSPRFLLHFVGSFLLGIILTIGFMVVRIGYWQAFMPRKYRELYEQYKIEDY